jgi:CubicO group peptidase (beta-lactamase class C family)
MGNTTSSARFWLKTGVVCLLVTLMSMSPIVSLAATDKQAEIRAMLATLQENGQFNGSILVAQNGVVVYRDAFGKGAGSWVSNRPDTPSNLASVSKQFTAMAVMMLKERGKIGYDDAIIKYLPELGRPGADITLRHLLTHTSGIPDLGDLGIDHSQLKESEVISAIVQQYRQFAPPGEKYRYSNTGYILLAMIVEKVAETPLDDFLARNIFSPLGMSATRLNERRGYTKGDGGIISTVDDLLKWDQALYTDKLVSQTTLSEAFTPARVRRGTSTYGFGWNIGWRGGQQFVWHTGNTEQYRAFIGRLLGDRLFIAILTNKGQSPRTEICEAIINILRDRPYAMPQLSIGMKLADVIKNRGVEAGIQEYQRLKATQRATYNFSEPELNSLGYELLGEGEREAAVRVFQLNTTEFPRSSNAYESLGEAYQKAGQKEPAIRAYGKALELDPKNMDARRMLKSLE